MIQKYGEDCVTQIITFGTMGARGVLRDVGRALNLPFADVDRIAKLVPAETRHHARRRGRAGARAPRPPEQGGGVREAPHLGAPTLEGLCRHASVHAAGVLITPTPLVDNVPLYKSTKGEVTTQ